jgi:hypothetical protein
MTHSFRSIFWSVIGILASGVVGALAGRGLIAAIGLDGLSGAIVAALVAMVVATAVWLAITLALRRLRIVP